MTKKYLAGAIMLLCAPLMADAAVTITPTAKNASTLLPALGIEYKARLVIDKAAALKGDGVSISLATGDQLNDTGANNDEKIVVAATKSMGWNDTATNPDVPACSSTVTTGCLNITDIAQGFGWGHNSHWYLVDLTALKGQTVHVHVMVERYDDGNHNETNAAGVALPSDDDLIPGLTVWKGYQNVGTSLHWFPNKHQSSTKPFWADAQLSTAKTGKLSNPVWPLSKTASSQLLGVNSAAVGYDTAYGQTDTSAAMVEGVVKLDAKDMNSNYLTIALGGDARHNAATLKHDVNYKLTVEVHKPHK